MKEQKIKIITIIGARIIPLDKIGQLRNIALRFAKSGWTLRSGGADGSDAVAESAWFEAKSDKKEIYLPWRGFRGSKSELYSVSIDALKMAQSFHPAWNKLTQGGQKLMGRNCYQVLGPDLKTPSDLLIAYTHNGELVGGTAQALKIAQQWNVPIINLGTPSIDIEKELAQWLEP